MTLPVLTWSGHLALPLLGLLLLLARPQLDIAWEDHGAHFGIVLVTALASLGLAVLVGERARRHADARLVLVSLVFGIAAGFLALHALGTPGVVVGRGNGGFVLATPVGLLLAGVVALASSGTPPPELTDRIVAWAGRLWVALGVLLATWAALSLAEAPLLAAGLAATETSGPLLLAALGGVALYAVAALRYVRLYRRRRSPVLLSIITAFVLLAETMLAIGLAPSWRLSWWEWHVLMVLAFGFVAYASRMQYRREGSRVGLFRGMELEATVAAIHRDHATALEELVDAVGHAGSGEWTGVRARLADRFELTDPQLDVLERAAEALASERDQIRRLGTLVEVGRQVSVIVEEEPLLADALALVRATHEADVITAGTLHAGTLRDADPGHPLDPATSALRESVLATGHPAELPDRTVLPLAVKGQTVGVLEVHRPGGAPSPRDRAVLASLASQLSVALENARLYRQLDGLFRSYLAPGVVTELLADPDRAALGGATADVSVLMADLAGFTPYSERTPPADVVGMLNRYYGAVVPVVLEHGGIVVQFVGDAVMALFGAPVAHADHPDRAVRAALGLQDAARQVAEPGWPRFRVGVNTGPALVGNIGSDAMRTYTAIGDTTNLAARLEAAAPPGGVVVAGETRSRLTGAYPVTPLEPLTLKGKSEPVPAYLLTPG